MTPDTLRIDRAFRGVGRIAKATGTTDPRVRRNIDRMLTALYEQGRLEILRAIRDNHLSLLQVYDAYQRHALDTLPTGKTAASLATAMQRWLDGLRDGIDVSAAHKRSLTTSRKYLVTERPKATVADLPDMLEALRDTLGMRYPRSFNLCRAAALSFIRDTLKSSHPLWSAVKAVKVRKSSYRRPTHPLTLDELRNFFPEPDRDPVDAIAWGMAMTGMGAGEYWGTWSVRADRIHIQGTKRKGRVRDVPLVRAPAVPTIHHRTFENAVRDRTNRAIQPYDLRRTYANWLEGAGIPRTRRKLYLGHGITDVTDLYERHEVTAFLVEDAAKLRNYLALPTEIPMLTLHKAGGA